MKLRILAILLIILGHLADYLSTQYGLAHGAIEGNPLFSYVGLVPTKIGAVAIQSIAIQFMPPKYALYLGIFTAMLLGAVAIWNILQAL